MTPPIDFSKVQNPFDFSNPVGDPEVFAGRKTELADIRYYLDQGSRSARPINLAVLGGRASGKTSLLNMIEDGALKRGYCVVRIDLDEGDTTSQLAFFLKIFDSLVTTACRDGAFGGLTGKTYETYRNLVDAFEVPEDKTFCTFIFPALPRNVVLSL